MLVEIVGWAGSIAVLLAYALLSSGRIGSTDISFQALNIGGAAGMAINGWVHGALPSVFNNVVWLSIGVFALIQLARARGRRQL